MISPPPLHGWKAVGAGKGINLEHDVKIKRVSLGGAMTDQKTGTACGWSYEEIRSKLGIGTAIWPKGEMLDEKKVARIREAGIRYMEISRIPTAFDWRNKKQVKEIKEACTRNDVVTSGFHCPFDDFKSNLSSEDEGLRRAAVADAVDMIHTSADMGADYYV